MSRVLLSTVISLALTCTVLDSTSAKKSIPRHYHGEDAGLTIQPYHNNNFEESQFALRGKPCNTKLCPSGQECRISEEGKAQCSCIERCYNKPNPVCGTDSKLYRSECDLYREACQQQVAVAIDDSSSCFLDNAASVIRLNNEANREGYEDDSLYSGEDSSSEEKDSWEEEQSGSKSFEGKPPKDTYLSTTFDNEDVFNSASGSSESNEYYGSTSYEKGDEDEDSFQAEEQQCSSSEYEVLKDNLLLFNHEKVIGDTGNFKVSFEARKNFRYIHPTSEREKGPTHPNGPSSSKDYLLSLMFSRFDENNNGELEFAELEKLDNEGKMGKLSPNCGMIDMLQYDDTDRNGQLDVNEFYEAFTKLYSVSVISLDKALETTHMTASVGDNVEIKCDVSGSPPMPIIWMRYGIDLSTLNQDEQVKVFPDGTLFLKDIQPLHSGNYSCHAQSNNQVVQTHILTVQVQPEVKVLPHIIWEQPGRNVTIECHVAGEPFPEVEWLKNDDPLAVEDPHKYKIIGDGNKLVIKNVYVSDTGAYMCKAENSGGKRLDISSLVVIDRNTPTSVIQTNESQLLVFHDQGISMYDPADCRLQHVIQATDVLLGANDGYVCGEIDGICDWGEAIKISLEYVYASQPALDRILVISIEQMKVADVISTDRYPVELHYVRHLDQVWVECWRYEENRSQKTLQVIREAKENNKHHTVHPEPIDSHFDLVEKLFLPPDVKSSSQFRYAYVSHKNGRGLYKMDLIALRYTKNIDFTLYNCVPQHMQFSALYGMVVVECMEPVTKRFTGQLVIDSLTDSVMYYKRDRFGTPYLSPDSRKLVTVSHVPDGTTILLELVLENGLEFSFDVKTSMNISDIAFFPSQLSHMYDLFASAVDKEDVLFVNLDTGKVEMISGVGSVLSINQWGRPSRPLTSQSYFGKFVATMSLDTVYVMSGYERSMHCKIDRVQRPQLVLWL